MCCLTDAEIPQSGNQLSFMLHDGVSFAVPIISVHGTRLHRIRMVVEFYNHKLGVWYRCIPKRYYPPLVLF